MNMNNVSMKMNSWVNNARGYISDKNMRDKMRKYLSQFSSTAFGIEANNFMKKHKTIALAMVFTIASIIYGIIVNTVKGNDLYTAVFSTMLFSIVITVALVRVFFIIDKNDKNKEKEAQKKKKWRELKRKEGELVLQKYGYTTPSEKRPMRRKKKEASVS